MKNLATCTPREFARQTARMARAVQKWLKATDIMNIRRNVPQLPEVPEITDINDADQVRKQEEAVKERRGIIAQAALDNAVEMILSMFEAHPDETLEVLAYCLFLDPSELDNYQMKTIMRSVTELISDEDVIDFFTSLALLAQKTGR